MAECYRCGRKRNPREELFKEWKDYTNGTIKRFCPTCWNKAVIERRRGFTVRYGLRQGKREKVSKLKLINLKKYEQKQRMEIKKKIGHCELCQSTENLQVHHYKPKCLKGRDEDTNYIVLCKECHKSYHPQEVV